MSDKRASTYHPAVDILRVISILAVVLIHTSSRTLETAHFGINVVPWTLFLNQIARFAVPLFFMISGFVLELNHKEQLDLGTFFRKRFGRLLVPYLVWSAIYYWLVYTKHAAGFLTTLLDGSSSYQLYFIPTILIFYLFFPFLHWLYGLFSNKFILISIGLVQVVLLHHEYFVQPLPFYYPVSIAILNYYVFILGMIASHNEERIIAFISKWKLFFMAAVAILAVDIYLEGQTNYLRTYNYIYIYSQWRPSIFLYTLGIAGLFFTFVKSGGSIEAIGRGLGKLAYFVFFVHVIVLEVFWKFIGAPLAAQTNSLVIRQLWFDAVFFILVAVGSFIVAYVAHKVPGLNKLTG